MSLTLYHDDMSVCAAKVRMALCEKALDWSGIHLDLRAGDAQRAEYVKLNPGQVVPTLVHDSGVVVESNVICEYLDDAFRERPLRPADPLARARMRAWTRQLDDGLHAATGTISTCIAFRHQHLARSADDLAVWLEGIVDRSRRERLRSAIDLGTGSPDFHLAVLRFERFLDQAEAALRTGPWLGGQEYSLADISYAPYLARLRHLGFEQRIVARPCVAEWAQRIMELPAFEQGVSRWFNPKYLELFERQRIAARSAIQAIVEL